MLALLFFLVASIRGANASFSNCATGPHSLNILDMWADPIRIVAANQPTSFYIQFVVPPTIHIPYTYMEILTNLNGIDLPVKAENFPMNLSVPKIYSFNYSMIFPPGIWGRLRSDILVYNSSGSKLLCARWIVFATNTRNNDTIWPF